MARPRAARPAGALDRRERADNGAQWFLGKLKELGAPGTESGYPAAGRRQTINI